MQHPTFQDGKISQAELMALDVDGNEEIDRTDLYAAVERYMNSHTKAGVWGGYESVELLNLLTFMREGGKLLNSVLRFCFPTHPPTPAPTPTPTLTLALFSLLTLCAGFVA